MRKESQITILNRVYALRTGEYTSPYRVNDKGQLIYASAKSGRDVRITNSIEIQIHTELTRAGA